MIVNPFEKYSTIYRSLCSVEEGLFFGRSDRAIYLVDLLANEGERVTRVANAPEPFEGIHCDTMAVLRPSPEVVLVATTQSFKVDEKISRHKLLVYKFSLL